MTEIITLIKERLADGTISEAQLLDIVGTKNISPEDEKATCALHSLQCREEHNPNVEGSCYFYEEENMSFPYSRSAHKKWYQQEQDTIKEYGFLSPIYLIDAISKVTNIISKIEDIRGRQGLFVLLNVAAILDDLCMQKSLELERGQKEREASYEKGELPLFDQLSKDPR